MTKSLSQIFEFSTLAQAAYADFSNVDVQIDALIRQRLQIINRGDFTEQQAQAFTDQTIGFSVLHHRPNMPDEDDGFSASVFQKRQNSGVGEITLAIRGTEFSRALDIFDPNTRDDLSDDADIFFRGIAIDQVVSLYNYYKLLTAAKDQAVSQLVLDISPFPPTQGQFVTTPDGFVSLREVQTGVGLGILTPENLGLTEDAEIKINVVGHSLGGHLAAVFSRLFTNDVNHVYTYNASGFGGFAGRGGTFAEEFIGLFSQFSQTTNPFDAKLITSIVGESGLELISDLGEPPSPQQEVFIENAAHSIIEITNSLAVHSLFATVDPNLTEKDLLPLLKATSNESEKSLETALDALGNLFLEPDDRFTTPIFDGPDDVDSRNEFHGNIQILQQHFETADIQNFSIVSLHDKSADTLRLTAELTTQSGIAFRYALRELNAFAVTSADAQSNLDLYSPHNVNGELNRENFSDDFLKDAADFLALKIELGLEDKDFKNVSIASGIKTYKKLNNKGDVQFTAEIKGRGRQRFFLFGGEGADPLVGDRLSDHIYGNGGDDPIEGKGGADILEGNAGDDTLFGGTAAVWDDDARDELRGGAGNDNYFVGNNDLIDDVIENNTVQGTIQYQKDNNPDVLISGRTLKPKQGQQSVYESGDADKFTFVLTPQNVLMVQADINFEIRNFQSGHFNITLDNTQPAENLILVEGTADDDSLTLTDAGEEIHGFDGNDVLLGQAIPNIEFQLAPGAGDVIFGETGDDVLASADGNDVLDGGDGNDLLFSGLGDDVLIGGPGDDFLDTVVSLIGVDSEHSVTPGEKTLFSVGGIGSNLLGPLLLTNPQTDFTFQGFFFRSLSADQVSFEDASSLFGGDGNDVLLGGFGNDFLDGGTGDDVIQGIDGNDLIRGGEGNDQLEGNGGADSIFGDAGDDIILGAGFDISLRPDEADFIDAGTGNDIVIGGLGDDTIFGREGEDKLFGGLGNDIIDGGPDNDVLVGDEGDDELTGGAGDDLLVGGADNDLLAGDAGADQLQGNEGNDILDGGEGNDLLVGQTGDDFILGGSGDDELQGNEGNDSLDGQEGNDTLFGGTGNDILSGGTGDDLLFGNEDDDQLSGGEGNDELQGQDGNDTLTGGSGDDRLFGDAGEDQLDGGEGDDELFGGEGDDQLTGGEGDDLLQGEDGNDTLAGGAGTDELFGFAGNDQLDGGEGDDHVQGDAGNDVVAGGSGNDFVSGGEGDDSLSGGTGNDSLFGRTGNDILDGGDGADSLDGAEGDDVLNGGAGSDILVGGIGADTQEGNLGHDQYRFQPGDGHDVITDASGFDNVRLLGGITFDAVTISENGADLVITIDDNNSLTFKDWQNNPFIDAFVFSDGVNVSGKNILSGADQGLFFNVSSSTNILNGTPGNDVFFINGDLDALDGGLGDDAYFFNRGTAIKQITDSDGEDAIVFGDGITVDDLNIPLVDGNLRILIGNERIEIDDWDNNRIERFLFADGTELSASEFDALINHPPVVGVPLADQQTDEDAPFNLQVPADAFTDPDATDSLIFSATLSDSSPLPSWLFLDPNTGAFSGTPGNNDVGAIDVKVTATDSGGLSASNTFNLTVNNINDAPVVSKPIPDRIATETFSFSYQIPPDTFTDPDVGDTLSFTATQTDGSALPAWLSFDPATQTFNGIPSDIDIGTVTVKVTATDNSNASVSDDFAIDVESASTKSIVTRIDGGTSRIGTQVSYFIVRNGATVSSAGDINGDGFNDVLVSGGNVSSGEFPVGFGESYVIFGQAGGLSDEVDINELDGSNGFRFVSPEGWIPIHTSSSAGDVNGDGLSDIIVNVGVSNTDSEFNVIGGHTNISYIVFGQVDGFGPTIDLASLNGTDGFQILGIDPESVRDISVSSAGDVNGDGLDDVIIGAPSANNGAGRSYVVFGRADGFPSSIDLTNLDGTNGFRLDGVDANDRSGASVSRAGDVNGDGYDDVVIGAPATFADVFGIDDSGKSYVVFGKANGFASAINLADLDGTNGFRLLGITANDETGFSVSGAGDVNNDGFDDVIIGAPNANNRSGDSYVVFGGVSGFNGVFNLDALDGTNGFRIAGIQAFEDSGTSVSSAGDVNGDGFDDVIIGAPLARPDGTTQVGQAYVVFGKADSFNANIELADLDGSNGFRINGANNQDFTGISVSSAGDINADGFDEIIIGAPGRGGISGNSYIVYGRDFRHEADIVASDGDDTINVTSNDKTVFALGGNDTINIPNYAGGGVSINTGSGNNTLHLTSLNISIDSIFPVTITAGPGNDTYIVNAQDYRIVIHDNASAGTGGNSIVFGNNINRSQMSLGLGSLVIRFGEGLGEIEIPNFDPDDVFGPRAVNTFEFADGTVQSYEEFISQGFDIDGTDGDDTLTGTNITDRISGFGGNDNISSGDGDDVITGGRDNDTMAGGRGDDGYVINLGDGHDMIDDIAGNDQIIFGDGIDVDSLQVQQVANDLAISLNANDHITIKDWFGSPDQHIEQFAFADNTLLSDADIEALIGADANQPPVLDNPIADQSADEDTLFNFQVPADSFADPDIGDSLSFSATLAAGTALPVWLSFDSATRTFSGTPTNNDVGSVEVTVTATDVEGLEASDTFSLTVNNTNDAPVVAVPLADQGAVEFQSFNFQVPGNTFSDEDVIHGDSFTLSATLADGSPLPTWLSFDPATGTFAGTPARDDLGTLAIAITATDTSLASVSDEFALTVNENPAVIEGTPKRDKIKGINGDDIILGRAENDKLRGKRGDDLIFGEAGNDRIKGDDGNDSLFGGRGHDELEGGKGDDHLDGGAGNDELEGDDGNDTLFGGDGNDKLEGDKGDDHLDGGPGNDELEGGKGNDVLLGGDGNDELEGDKGDDTLFGGAGDDELEGDKGNDFLDGGAGNDELEGDDGDDILIGGQGNDWLEGGKGNDTYRINRNDGMDTIYDKKGDMDIVSFGDDITADELWFSRDGKHLEISLLGTNDQLTIAKWYKGSSRQIEEFHTSDGAVLLNSQVNQLVAAMAAFDPPLAGEISLTVQEQQQIVATIAAAWESA